MIKNQIKNFFNFEKTDKLLLIVIVVLSFFGVVMVYSGSVLVAVKQGNEPTFYFVRQLVWVILGLTVMMFFYHFDYHKLQKLSLPGLIIGIILLITVLLVNWDQSIKRWIDLGPFDLQPSEIAKLVFLIYLASWLATKTVRKGKGLEAFKHHFFTELLPFLMWLGVILLLIFIQPDLDTAIILGATAFIVYFIAGQDIIHFWGSVLTAGFLAIVGFISAGLASYRVERLQTFFDFWKNGFVSDPFGAGYQLRQILVAVASGGIFGVGFGESRQKFHYLGDTAFSDTIFAIIGEEFGFNGVLIIIVVFLFILFKGIKIAISAPDRFGFLLALSITIWLVLQAFLHISANVALLPINGNTLPFVSYGGSSTIINLAAIGILLNIATFNKASNTRSYAKRNLRKIS